MMNVEAVWQWWKSLTPEDRKKLETASVSVRMQLQQAIDRVVNRGD